VVICHEIIAWIKHYMVGLVIDEESLALELVDEVGTDGHFIETDHTRRHFKEDEYPELRDHHRYDDWLQRGGTTLKERARAKVETVLAEHLPPKLDGRIRKTLKKIAHKE
jgi:trimethylamine--corrinoid protein Co-methyltransferase